MHGTRYSSEESMAAAYKRALDASVHQAPSDRGIRACAIAASAACAASVCATTASAFASAMDCCKTTTRTSAEIFSLLRTTYAAALGTAPSALPRANVGAGVSSVNCTTAVPCHRTHDTCNRTGRPVGAVTDVPHIVHAFVEHTLHGKILYTHQDGHCLRRSIGKIYDMHPGEVIQHMREILLFLLP